MTLSIIIPAYNEELYIGKTLESIFKNPPDNLLEVIVINNASTDKTAEVAALFPKVKVVTESQKGLTKARQRGLQSAQGDLIAYIDADTWVSKQWFATVNEEFNAHPNLVCLSGPYIYYDIPSWQSWWVKQWWYVAEHAVKHVTHYLALGGNFVAKRKALLDIGGFDVNIEFYGEDTDIARRLYSVGEVKFIGSLAVQSSGRRIMDEGLVKMGIKYAANFAAVALFKKPVTREYKDIR
jgi:glycosyltransferase involved in cell wall biosynthesis